LTFYRESFILCLSLPRSAAARVKTETQENRAMKTKLKVGSKVNRKYKDSVFSF